MAAVNRATSGFLCLFLVGALSPACIEPDLGDVPFLCNHGDPECPEGYTCVANKCVRDGINVSDSTASDTTSDSTPGPDWLAPWPETSPPDWLAPTPDGPQIKWDLGALDMPKPANDGWPPHLGCQTHQECASDASNPCCCPMPLLPQVWVCLPLCLNPFCI